MQIMTWSDTKGLRHQNYWELFSHKMWNWWDELSSSSFVSTRHTYLQLLLLVGSDDFQFIVDNGGLGQVEGVGLHWGERGGGPSDPSVQAEGGRAAAGRSHGPEPRGHPRKGAAHARGGDGEPGRVPENLPVRWRGEAVSVAHLRRESEIKVRDLKSFAGAYRQQAAGGANHLHLTTS